jgi:hypothetical protein
LAGQEGKVTKMAGARGPEKLYLQSEVRASTESVDYLEHQGAPRPAAHPPRGHVGSGRQVVRAGCGRQGAREFTDRPLHSIPSAIGVLSRPPSTRYARSRRSRWRTTRLLSFDSPGLGTKRAQRERSFDFLGLTHFWARSRKGRWVVKQRTAKSRFARGLKALKERCRKMRHRTLQEQHEAMCRMLRGHFNYYGITACRCGRRCCR